MSENAEYLGIKIVFLPYGNVVVGHVYRDGEREFVRCGHVIRRWGTIDGIGEIAMTKPTSDTTLDKFGGASWHVLMSVIQFDCSDKWLDVIGPRPC